jgi:hypothetical protein
VRFVAPSPHHCPTPWFSLLAIQTMKRESREFIRSTTTLLDHLLGTLTQEEQHELLDAIAGEIEERMDALVEAEES